MAQDPAGRAVLVGGVMLLIGWLAIAAATAWLVFHRTAHPVHPAWLWAGGLLTLLGGIVLGVLIVQTIASFGGQRERDYQTYLESLRADERRRSESAEPD